MTTGSDVTGAETHSPDGAARMLQHHFESPDQQFDSSKLGMWIFLGTEMLMFGGLFCAYAIYRANHPDIFRWGSHLLDVRAGAINTVVLITSSFTMACAVMAAQRGWRWRQVVLLALTFLGACGFLAIKYTEYRPKFEHGLLWGKHFHPDPAYVAAHFGGGHHGGEEAAAEAGDAHEEKAAEETVDLELGRKIAYETCASCHGRDLRGMPKNGKNLVTSEFVAQKSDAELLAFLKVGRQPFDPANTTGVAMPPRGGNPTLDDAKLKDVIAFLRVVQEQGEEEGSAEGGEVAAVGPPEAAGGDESLFLPKSVIPPAPQGPPGLVPALTTRPAPPAVPPTPAGAHRFFAVYFLMTGLHAVHVIAGMVVIAWLMIGAALGRYDATYYTPVDLGGLFWHLVDLIWIFLFPLFYLIH